jgi:hypothetical protein
VIEGAAHATISKKTEQYMELLEGFLDAAEARER